MTRQYAIAYAIGTILLLWYAIMSVHQGAYLHWEVGL